MENRLKKIFTVLALTVMLLAGWASLRFLPSFDPAADEADLNDDLIGNTPGRLMLQIHDGNDIKVLWRNFKLKQL